MSKLDEYENPDEANNPSSEKAAEQSRQAAGDSSGSSKNIDDIKQQENSPDTGLYRPGSGNGESGRVGRSGDNQPRKAQFTNFVRKRAAMFTVGGGILGFGTIFTIFLSPGLLLIQLSEVLNDKFNDQLAALDTRSTLIMKKKLNTQVYKGVCLEKVTIKCKYRTISKNQAKRLTAAGMVPVNGEDVIEGRGKPTAFRFEGREIQAKDLLNEARGSPAVRSALLKGYNPSFAAWADANAYKMLERFGIKKSSAIDPSEDREKMRQQLSDVAKGDVASFDGKKLIAKDADGNTVTDESLAKYYESEDGKVRVDDVKEGARLNTLIQETIDRGGFADKLSKTLIKSGIKGALTSTAFGAGAVDSVCTAWNLVRLAGYAAKIYQQRQLIRFAYEVQKQGEALKAGQGNPEVSGMFGDMINNYPNAEGTTGMNSVGYNYAAYGDAFSPGDFSVKASDVKSDYSLSEESAAKVSEQADINNEVSRFVSGQALSDNIIGNLAKAASPGSGAGASAIKAADDTCGFVKSFTGQAIVIGLAVAGLFVAAFSGGTSLGWGVGLQAAASVTISVAFALLQPKLLDMAKGEVITNDMNSNEVINATVSGSGGINAQASQTRGLPVQEKEDYLVYSEYSKDIAASYDEIDRYEKSPFDPTSKNTFVGSILASLTPYVAGTQTVGSSVLSAGSFITSTFGSLGTRKAGASDMSMDQIDKCNDYEYRDYAADPFCNLRYGMSPQDLAIDPEVVVDYMLAGGYINADDDPTPTPGEAYEEYIKICIDRKSSIGDDTTGLDGEEGGESNSGEEYCIDGKGGENEERNTMFRLFYIDTSVDDGMEGDFGVAHNNTAALSGGSTFIAATLNVEGYSHSSGDYKKRLDASIENLTSNGTEIAGLQEFQRPQRDYFLGDAGGGETFAVIPENADYTNHLSENSIIYNKSRFEKVEDGVMPDLKYFNGSKLRVPWVKLRDIATTQEFYVLNTHDPAKPENAKYRYENAQQHVKFINSLKEKDGLPIVFTGDFNSGFSVRTSANTTYEGKDENLTYCILTKDETVKNTFDMQESREVKCPNPGNDNSVDHIYVSSSIQLTKYWKTTQRGVNGNGSDSHDTHFSQLVIPGGTLSNGAGTEFVIGSYNQKRSLSVAAHTTAVNNIVNWKMDVVGTQEDSNPKFTRYKQQLGAKGYDVFPTTLPAQVQQTCAGSQAIFYNKSKFAFEKGEFISYPRYPGQQTDCGGGESSKRGEFQAPGLPDVWTNTPVVWLRDVVTEQTIIVINTHGVANVALANSTQPAKSRYESAKIYVREIERLKSENPGVPIFFTGDFNEGTGVRTKGNVTYQGQHKNLLYCMFAQNKLMLDAEATSLNKATSCPNPSIGGVDYIYHSPEATVTNFTIKSREAAASDHPVIYARMVVAGSGAVSSGAGDIRWPVDKKWWDADRNDFLGAHPTYSGTFTSPYEKGIAADIGSPPDGSPVYAMASGKVTRINLCGDDDGMEIESTINGKKLYIAYGHGVNPKFKPGDTVQAGQQILDLGAKGCQVTGGHLHIDMSYDGEHICPQDVFYALGNGQTPNFEFYKTKGISPCRR